MEDSLIRWYLPIHYLDQSIHLQTLQHRRNPAPDFHRDFRVDPLEAEEAEEAEEDY